MIAFPRPVVPVLLVLAVLGGCAPESPENPESPRESAAKTTPARPGVGPYRMGDCVTVSDGVAKISCDRPHEYEVMMSDHLPAGTPEKYPPPVATTARPTCQHALPRYLGSTDAPASRLEALAFWPTEQQWARGARWFACLVTERDPGNDPKPRTGRLAGALAKGLGEFQRCLAGEPLSDDPVQVVPCRRPHRSEAVPGVLDLGTHTDPPPGKRELIDKVIPHCDKKVNDYLGGKRAGITASGVMPLPEDWRTGTTSAVCYAVSDTPVTGTQGGRG